MTNLLVCGPSFLSPLFTRKADHASMKEARQVYSLKVLPYRQQVLGLGAFGVGLLLGVLLLCAKGAFFKVLGVLFLIAGIALAVLLLARANNAVVVVRGKNLKVTKSGEKFTFDDITDCRLHRGKKGACTMDILYGDDKILTVSSEFINFHYLRVALQDAFDVSEDGEKPEPDYDGYDAPEEVINVQNYKQPVKADEDVPALEDEEPFTPAD